jgi:transposase
VIQLQIRIRRFFCDFPDCQQQTFAERVPEIANVRGRKTCRLTKALSQIGFAAGGESGSRLAGELGMPISPDTMLRLMRQASLSMIAEPRVVGVDDWAFHRSQRYGTILCDLELHRPIDLLPERSASTLAAWLQRHPGIQIISRDRSGEYAKGASAGAPQARQVADRWHLLHNLIEAFEQALDRHHTLLAEVSKKALWLVPRVAADQKVPVAPGSCITDGAVPPTIELTRRQQLQEDRRTRRQSRYRQVKELQDQGLTLRKIAQQLRLSRCTVRRFARTEQFPDRALRPKTASLLDKFLVYLQRRWEEGCHSAAQLYREVRNQGFAGSQYMVRRRVAAWRDLAEAAHVTGQATMPKQAHAWRPSARSVTWLLLKPDKVHSTEQQAFLAALQEKWPELAENVILIQEFRQLLCRHNPDDLETWMGLAAEPSILPEIKRFAQNLRPDWPAVVEAVRQPWSNGQVEGQVNRLKLIKRQMYGRANFDLLRQRVLHGN